MTPRRGPGVHLARRRRPRRHGRARRCAPTRRSPGPPGSSTRRARRSGAGRFPATTARDWTWNGRDAAGAVVADGRYTFRVSGLDRAGNPTIRATDGPRRPDDQVADLGARSSFVPRAGAKRPLHGRPPPAGDGHGGDLPGLDAGPHGSGPAARLAAGHVRLDVERQDGRRGATSSPGTYRVVVDATSSIGALALQPAASRSRRRSRPPAPSRLDRHDRHDRTRQRAVRRARRRPPTRRRRRLGRPADLQRGREHRADVGRHPRGAARRRRSSSSTTARPTARATSPTRWRRPTRASGSAIAPRSRASGAPTSTASASPWPAARRTVVQMDADFSHDPAALPGLVAPIADGDGRPRHRLALHDGRRRSWTGASAGGSSRAAGACSPGSSSVSARTT